MHLKTFFNTLLISLAYSLPNGAPKCSIGEDAIKAGHGKPQENLGYELVMSTDKIEAGKSIEITIKNSAGKQDLLGILMYIQGKDAKKHLGKFDKIPNGLKPQTAICSSSGFAGDAASTLTHANPSSKPLANLKFSWTPLPGDEKDAGPITLNAVIGTNADPNTGTPQWQIVAPKTLSAAVVAVSNTVKPAAAGTAAPAPSTPPTSDKADPSTAGKADPTTTKPNTAGKKMYKCKPKKNY